MVKGKAVVGSFIHVLVNSFFPKLDYYQKLPKTRFLFSFKYFVALIFILNTILLSIFLIKIATSFDLKQVQQSLYKSLDSYPADLTITIKNNRLMTTYDRPYIMYFNYNGVPHPLIVVDEFATAEKINSYEAAILLTRDGFAVRQNEDNIQFYNYKQNNAVSISKEGVTKFKKAVTTVFNLLPLLLLLTLIVMVPFVSAAIIVSRFLYLAIVSFFVFLFFRLILKELAFKKVLQVSLHATTAPFVLESVLLALGLSVQLPFWFLLINSVFIVGGVYEAYLDKTKTH